jgi:hypothetical protein
MKHKRVGQLLLVGVLASLVGAESSARAGVAELFTKLLGRDPCVSS